MLIRVLLIEDDPADALLFREMLNDCCATADSQGESIDTVIHQADRLAAGVRQAAAGGVDIILADLGLPDSQGRATVRKLAAAVPHLPIVVLTGLADQRAGFEMVNAGAQDYLVKGQVTGEMLVRSIRYAIERKKIANEKEQVIVALQQALAKVKMLSGLLPICCSCKKIRDDQGYWQQIEAYIHEHSEAEFSHGICPECSRKLYPEFCPNP